MKSIDQINHARGVLKRKCMTPGMNATQTALLSGMLQSLVWAADGPDCSTMERILAGEQIAAGKDSTEAMLTLALMRTAPDLFALAKRVVEIFEPMHAKGQCGQTFELLLARAQRCMAMVEQEAGN